MKQSVKFTLLVVLFSAYFVQAHDEETSNQGNDGDTFNLIDDIFQNNISESDPKRAGRIVGRNDVVVADYPYVVSIRLDKLLQTTPFFVTTTDFVTGVIISNTQVLTAASNFDTTVVAIQIRAGSSNRVVGGTVFTNTSYKVHGSYNNVTGENDVAIININNGTFAGLPSVKPIELETSVLVGSSQNPISCFIVGWGSDVPNQVSYTLKRADYNLSTDAVCAAKLNTTVPSSVQCVTSVSGYGCFMDQGDPVVCNNRLYGIFKAVSDCKYDLSQTYTHLFAKIPASSIKSFIFPKKSYFPCPCDSC